MYEPSGRVAARSAIVAHSVSSQPKPSDARSAGEPSGSKQLRVPRWHVGPTGSTVTSSASRSQSSAMSTRRSTLPLVSPFRHSVLRDREWKWTSPVATVAFERLLVHPGEHQHAPVGGVLDDCRDEPVVAELRIDGHAATPAVVRTGNPAPAIADLTDAIEWIRRWKIEAASTASAPPSRTAATKSAGPAAPPEAMTGTDTRSVIARSRSVSKPSPVPSRSIEVTSSSPAPSSTARWAHSTASSGVASRPPLT